MRPSVTAEVRALETAAKPIAGYAADYQPGHDTGLHGHLRDQLVHGEGGVMSVRTAAGAWIVPPGFAVWVPAGIEHRVRARSAVTMRTLYLAAAAEVPVGSACRVVRVPPLARELIHRVTEIGVDYPEDGPEARLVAVLADELRGLEPVPLDLPMPADRRVLAVASGLLEDPADPRTLGEWARAAGASDRTLARLFERETGLTFAAWRRRRRLLAALERLDAGEPVTTVALDLGYASVSAFIAMFHRTLGAPPTRYLGGQG